MPEPAAASSCGRRAPYKQRVVLFTETLISFCCPRKRKAVLFDVAAWDSLFCFLCGSGGVVVCVCVCVWVLVCFLSLVRSSGSRFPVRSPAAPPAVRPFLFLHRPPLLSLLLSVCLSARLLRVSLPSLSLRFPLSQPPSGAFAGGLSSPTPLCGALGVCWLPLPLLSSRFCSFPPPLQDAWLH